MKLPIALFALLCSVAVSAQSDRSCGRECLVKQVDMYLAALVAHDPKRVPFTANAVVIENLKRIQAGEGLWRSATAVPTTFKIYVPDEQAQQIGFMGVMEEGGKPLMIALRLKLMDGRIQEAEHVLTRNLKPDSLQNLQRVRTGLLEDVPESEREPRYVLRGIAFSYYDAVDFNNSKLAPFAADCSERENGQPDAGIGGRAGASASDCVGQHRANIMVSIDAIDNVRILAIDPVTGLAFGLSQVRPDPTRRDVPAASLPAAHVFKIRGGKIHEIEAMGFVAPPDPATAHQ
ncbi:MAG TPA: hypothetical protein VMH83_08800 [Candidatus Acidoferrum sp.]|nr:hypothetical protein [Candidatus Acidoferrum sp.]